METKEAQAYERAKEQAAERSRLASRAGREIAPLPPIGNAKRRAACKYDLRRFLLTYLPKKFAKPFSANHDAYIAALQQIVLDGGKQSIAMPRGVGKSTVCKGAVNWATLYGHSRYTLVVSATKTEAVEFLADIKKSLVSDLIVQDFPEVGVPLKKLGNSALLARGQLYYDSPTSIVWQADKVKLPNIPGSVCAQSTIRVVGVSGAIRGASADGTDGETLRPELVVLDDLQKLEDARNPERVKKIVDKVDRDVGGLAADGERMAQVMVCTCIEPDDVSAHYLSHEEAPQWNGLRFKMVEKFPDRLDDLWLREYAALRRKSPAKANAFYRANRAEMDAGAVVDWEESFDRKQEASRLQRAMNYLIDDESSFWSERQNEPRTFGASELVCDARTIRTRLNGMDQFVVPEDAETLTAFVDVHADILYYCVCAWKEDRTCFVVNYGSFPEQREEYFFKSRAGNATLKQTFGTVDVDACVQEGVYFVAQDLLGTTWSSESGRVVGVSRLCVDVGYKRAAVEAAIRRLNTTVVSPSKGRAIGAGKKPIAEWNLKPGARKGRCWIAEPTPGRPFKTITFDVNYLKSEVHEAFYQPVGAVGGASLWGTSTERHRMFADHLTAEKRTPIKRNGNEVAEWSGIPGRDNHLFDCVVGCLGGAYVQGLSKPGESIAGSRQPVAGSR